MTVSSTFCVEPAGDTPTRSHLFLAVLSGCIPVLLDSDAPSYENGKTPWAFRKSEDTHSDDFWPSVDYESFTVSFNTTEVGSQSVDIVKELRKITPERLAGLRRGLDAVAPLLRYSPHEFTTPRGPGQVQKGDAFSGLASIVEFVHRIDSGGGQASV